MREKLNRRRTQLFKLQEDNVNDELDNTGKYLKKQISIIQVLDDFIQQEEKVLTKSK